MTQTAERKQQVRLARIEKCLSYFNVITTPAMTPSGYTTYAVVNSTSKGGRRYLVTLDESGDVPVATRCNCDATVRCIHMDAVDCYYKRIAGIFAHDEAKQVAETQEVVEQLVHVDQLASYSILEVADTIRVDFNVAIEREEKKAASFAYGCCGHLVHVKDEGQLCGSCRCK